MLAVPLRGVLGWGPATLLMGSSGLPVQNLALPLSAPEKL